MRLMLLLFAGISWLFLAGCETVQQEFTADPCATFGRIEFTTETKEWLQELEWPDSAYNDFGKVQKHNQKWDSRCAAFDLNDE